MSDRELVKTAAWALIEARRDRDDAVVAMRENGATLEECAEAAGLSGPGVSKLIARWRRENT